MPQATQKVIGLFSSDARPLYTVDVYRALALPKGYVLHYRYRRAHIAPALLSRIAQLKNASGMIFFVAGNDLSKPDTERAISLSSIRKVIIRDVDEDLSLDLVHFYMELGDFADARPHSETATELLPPRTFVSELLLDLGPNNRWEDRVSQIRGSFPNLTFVELQSVRRGNKVMKPIYNEDTRSSQYSLDEESLYQANIAWYNPSTSTLSSGLQVTNSNGDAVRLVAPLDHRFGAPRDTEIFEVQTHTISQRRTTAITYFYDRDGEFEGKKDGAIWRVELKWCVTRGRWKALLFGFVSALAALGVAFAKVATEDLSTWAFDWKNATFATAAILLIGVAAGWLYEFFNKK